MFHLFTSHLRKRNFYYHWTFMRPSTLTHVVLKTRAMRRRWPWVTPTSHEVTENVHCSGINHGWIINVYRSNVGRDDSHSMLEAASTCTASACVVFKYIHSCKGLGLFKTNTLSHLVLLEVTQNSNMFS